MMIDLRSKKDAPADLPTGRQEASGENPPRVKVPHLRGLSVSRKPLLIGLLLLAGVAAVAGYLLLPRIETRRLASRLHPSLVELKDSLSGVNSDLGDLFTLVSGEEAPPSQTSFLNLPWLFQELRGRVAGKSVKFAFYDLLYQLRKDLFLITNSPFSGTKDFGRKVRVAGAKVTQSEDETITDLRQVSAKAQSCGDSVTTSRDKLSLLSSALPQRFPSLLADTGNDLSSLVQDSDSYLSEAEKAAHYYEVITGVQIELVPALISLINLIQDLYYTPDPLLYLGTIDTLAGTIDDLNQKVEALSDSLPAGMEKLHADNLAVFTLISELLAEMKTAITKNDFLRFDDAVVEFDIGLEVLATRARTFELAFWQETELLKGYGDLSARYDQIETELAEFKKAALF